jgi:hypothetical protein
MALVVADPVLDDFANQLPEARKEGVLVGNY